jgi:hypothetical protein
MGLGGYEDLQSVSFDFGVMKICSNAIIVARSPAVPIIVLVGPTSAVRMKIFSTQSIGSSDPSVTTSPSLSIRRRTRGLWARIQSRIAACQSRTTGGERVSQESAAIHREPILLCGAQPIIRFRKESNL